MLPRIIKNCAKIFTVGILKGAGTIVGGIVVKEAANKYYPGRFFPLMTNGTKSLVNDIKLQEERKIV